MNEIAFEKLDEQAEILENEIKLSLQELEELNKQQAEIGTPDGLGKTLMNTVWEQFELQLSVQAGEDFIKGNKGQTLDLSDDAHIQTTENFEKGKIATHNTKIDYQERYEQFESQFQHNEDGSRKMQVDHRTGQEKAVLEKGARERFDRGRPMGSKTVHKDHTIPAAEIARDAAANAHLSWEEQEKFANSETNLVDLDASANQSKGDSSMKEWLDSERDGRKPAERFNIDEEQLRETDKKARRKYNRLKKEGEKRSVEEGKKSQMDEAMRAGEGALKAIVMSLLKDLIKKIFTKFVSWLKNSSRSISELLAHMKEAVSNFIRDLKKNVFSSLKASAISIMEMFWGKIVRTLTKVYSFIKQGWVSLKDAYKYITNPENRKKPVSIMVMEVSKIIIAGLSGASAILLGEFIEDALMTIPVFAIEIPLFGSIASIVGLFLGAVVAGIIGGIAINVINYFIKKKLRSMVVDQKIDKGNEILKKQNELIGIETQRTSIQKERVAKNIMERHQQAAQVQKESIEIIFENSQKLQAQDERIAKAKDMDLTEDFVEMNNTLDELLKKSE